MNLQTVRNTIAGVVTAGAYTLAAAQASGGIDVSEATTKLGEVATAVAAVGLLVFGIGIAIKLYKWLKAAL